MAVRTATITPSGLLRWARSEDWITLLLIITSMVVVVRSVEVAEWVATPSLSLAAVLGAFTGLMVARIPWKAWQGHLLALGVGGLATYLQVASLTEATTVAARMSELNSHLAAWWTALVKNDISTDTLPFAFILSALSWLGGYLASRTVFKGGNVWLAVVPSALGLVINLTYLPERYYFYIFPFLLATMMLIVRVHSVQQAVHLERQGIGHPPSLQILWMVTGLVLSSLIVGGVSLLPPNHATQETLVGVWNGSRRPVEWFQEEFGRLFSAVGTKGVHVARRFGATLSILPIIPTGTETVFSGDVSYPAYWKVRAYNTYTSVGWSSNDTTLEPAPTSPPLLDDFEGASLALIDYKVKVASPTYYLYVPSPNADWFSVPAQIEHSKGIYKFSDVFTLRPKKRLETGGVYYGSFLSPLYTENTLRSTSQDYPRWAKERYLGLPASLPERVKDLAIQLTQDANNAYDEAQAIEKYLRSYKYGTLTSVPRYNQDLVDHFLFESKIGHSDHFASAMTVLLRAAGIPARLVSGYGFGEMDEEDTSFTVKESDQHSWTEAYIPLVGWVEFEPSPIYPLRPHQASDLAGFGAGLIGINSDDAIPEESEYNSNQLEEIDPRGGELPGGEGARPFPLMLRVSPWSPAGVLFMGLVAMWVAGLVWLWRRSFLLLPNPEMAYARMHRMARLLVVEPQQGHTPREFGKALAAAIPEFRDDILVICDAYCKTRYGGTKLSEQDGLGLRLAWKRVQKAMVRNTLN